ncbi:protein SMALL AUXIN UP-REGULATED RNA 54-like [Cryptomeria japonica]|uniref:protein SMALL AUXIN UP-REGULATED RNA 54-like n=1 Tax=Cryptomeria japonica TaxID=3369 RepID=UPI0027DA184E|nr:protein SMALL AUXIN UP-REGULATED RNA 54-like [Cryptomeria japonica]
MARIKGNSQVLLVKNISRSLCRFANAHKPVVHALSSKSTSYFIFTDEFMGRSCGALPTDVPKGHCAVYVGSERSRFIIPIEYFNHSVFRALLDKAEEGYGFDHHIGLIIPFEEIAFQYLPSMILKKDPVLRNTGLDKVTDFHSSTFCSADVD